MTDPVEAVMDKIAPDPQIGDLYICDKCPFVFQPALNAPRVCRHCKGNVRKYRESDYAMARQASIQAKNEIMK